MPKSSGNPMKMKQPQKQPQQHQLHRTDRRLPLCWKHRKQQRPEQSHRRPTAFRTRERADQAWRL